MPVATFSCPKCKTALAIEPGTAEIVAACPHCGEPVEAYFFPAFFRSLDTGAAAAALADHTEASCFYHPQKQALRVCDGCGRMICALCSVDLGAEHLCPTCIATGASIRLGGPCRDVKRLREKPIDLLVCEGPLGDPFFVL